jgi:hypothetical protein
MWSKNRLLSYQHPSIQWSYSPYRALASSLRFRNSSFFYGVGLLAPRPTPNLKYQVSVFMTPGDRGHIDAKNPFPIHMVTETSSVTSSLHHMLFTIFLSPLFLSHVLVCYWIAARSSSPPISTIKFSSLPTACPT